MAGLVRTLTLLVGCAACVQLDWSRERIDLRPADAEVHALVVGEAELGEALRRLGAPLEAWELPGEGVALAWGGLEQEELGVSLSIPLQKGLDAQFDYSDAQALVRGHVLFFDGEGVLVATGEGLLDDLRKASERRPSSVE
ncbi:MAG: hypothetical protein RL112_2361 [Planctomycetota bacterium]|jgi:hypothetical protein